MNEVKKNKNKFEQFILFRFVSIDNEKETIGTVFESNGSSWSLSLSRIKWNPKMKNDYNAVYFLLTENACSMSVASYVSAIGA